jgi:hypothetical protein
VHVGFVVAAGTSAGSAARIRAASMMVKRDAGRQTTERPVYMFVSILCSNEYLDVRLDKPFKVPRPVLERRFTCHSETISVFGYGHMDNRYYAWQRRTNVVSHNLGLNIECTSNIHPGSLMSDYHMCGSCTS